MKQNAHTDQTKPTHKLKTKVALNFEISYHL